MPDKEKNSWDHANRQGKNRDFNDDRSDSMYLKKDDQPENPNKEADGYGAESSRSDHSDFSSGFGSRSGNSNTDDVSGSRSNEDLGSKNSGASGRSSGH